MAYWRGGQSPGTGLVGLIVYLLAALALAAAALWVALSR
jgi:hypothetical protein